MEKDKDGKKVSRIVTLPARFQFVDHFREETEEVLARHTAADRVGDRTQRERMADALAEDVAVDEALQGVPQRDGHERDDDRRGDDHGLVLHAGEAHQQRADAGHEHAVDDEDDDAEDRVGNGAPDDEVDVHQPVLGDGDGERDRDEDVSDARDEIDELRPHRRIRVHGHHGREGDRVSTESSLNFYFTGEAGTKPMILANRGGGGGGGGDDRQRLAQLKPSEPMVQPKVRKVFPDTAFWQADIKTDQNGRAQAQLSFPDSLTTWRATIRGVTVDTKVGSATNRVIVRKNLMVRLAVPRFFRQGDDVTVSTIVHNYLPNPKTARL